MPFLSDINGTIGSRNEEEIIFLLDIGLGDNNPGTESFSTSGKILKMNLSRGDCSTVVVGQSMPDGIDVSRSAGRIFWTNMGQFPSAKDGSVHSAKLDGSDVRTVLAPGLVHTPKQLVIDDDYQKIYLCDREGMGVHRTNFDGTEHELLIQTGAVEMIEDQKRWCVGLALDGVRGYIYWTQKGPSKGGRGRIFRAGLDIPAGQSAFNRTDIECLFDNLPEPIDLEFDANNQILYWTDRGEHPAGCSLNKADMSVATFKHKIVARHFHEPIGLKIDREGAVLVSDLGGGLYRVRDGKKTVLLSDDGSYTGIALL